MAGKKSSVMAMAVAFALAGSAAFGVPFGPLAAVGDGTIRWFRASDGKPLLSLFVQTMDNRWILWTPKGYYAASAGGENLIGWNVNRGETVALLGSLIDPAAMNAPLI